MAQAKLCNGVVIQFQLTIIKTENSNPICIPHEDGILITDPLSTQLLIDFEGNSA